MLDITTQAAQAKAASFLMATISTEQKNTALLGAAAALRETCAEILLANAADLKAAQAVGMSESLLDRLMLTEDRVQAMAEGLEQVAALPDPVGELLAETKHKNGMVIQKVRVPLGLIGIIYEARPNVTADAAALALKTGNAVLLRGSASAVYSNRAIVDAMRSAIARAGLPADAIMLVEDLSRDAARVMMRLDRHLDVLIPRGGAALIRDVLDNATVPVLETGIGNCHIFIDQSAALEMALPIVINAKTQRPSVCNAAEKLLVHSGWPKQSLAAVLASLHQAGVALRGDDRIRATLPELAYLEPLPESEYPVEYLDLVMGVIMVDSAGEAIAHINRYGSRHTEVILTEDKDNAAMFLAQVDAAAVGHNVSTRFTDGFEYGFGAEIGISTQKLHARGPMGLPELTSYKYVVRGSGQVRE